MQLLVMTIFELICYSVGTVAGMGILVVTGLRDLTFPRDLVKLTAVAGLMALIFGTLLNLVFAEGLRDSYGARFAMEILVSTGVLKVVFPEFGVSELKIYVPVLVGGHFMTLFFLALLLSS